MQVDRMTEDTLLQSLSGRKGDRERVQTNTNAILVCSQSKCSADYVYYLHKKIKILETVNVRMICILRYERKKLDKTN